MQPMPMQENKPMTSALSPQIADYAHLEILPDPPKIPDMRRTKRVKAFYNILGTHFGRREDVLIAGNGYLRADAADDKDNPVLGCVVTFGVNPEGIIARNGYVISEVGKPPDFVLEIATEITGRNDCTHKRNQYEKLGVREYWRFDHTGGEYHDAPLAGDTLVDGRYERLPIHEEADGMLWGHSAMLGLDVCWDGGELCFRAATRDFIPRAEEVMRKIDAAKQRADNAEAENARLREQLRRLQQNP